jgi:hypothetical protein
MDLLILEKTTANNKRYRSWLSSESTEALYHLAKLQFKPGNRHLSATLYTINVVANQIKK